MLLQFTALKQTSNSVDEVVKLLTLEPILSHKSTLLIRLENFCDWDDKKQVTVNLEVKHKLNKSELEI